LSLLYHVARPRAVIGMPLESFSEEWLSGWDPSSSAGIHKRRCRACFLDRLSAVRSTRST
jgi:hypothetical protein